MFLVDITINMREAILAFLSKKPAKKLGAGFKESIGAARKKCHHCKASNSKSVFTKKSSLYNVNKVTKNSYSG